MGLVKVFNDNDIPYEEEFKGEMIKIGAGKYVVMDREKATLFKGTMIPIKVDAGGRQKKESYKKIRLVAVAPDEKLQATRLQDKRTQKLRCHGCAFEADSLEKMDAHINDYHLDDLADQKEREKRVAKKG